MMRAGMSHSGVVCRMVVITRWQDEITELFCIEKGL